MTTSSRSRAKGAYHHGNLEHALVQAALETIRDEGVQALTLRSVGGRVGVSRTALYRHFDDKAALLARVASEGFRVLFETMTQAIANSSDEQGDTLEVMAAAYVHFALSNPSHYQTMFGGYLTEWERYPELIRHADAAFQQLVEVIRREQQGGRMGPGSPVAIAEIVWSLNHGVATLGLARHLPRTPMSVEELAVQGARFLRAGMRATAW